MPDTNSSSLPLLPLVLWDTPPGLERILYQEGVSFVHGDVNAASLRAGRFVLCDSRRTPGWRLRAVLSNDQVAVDIDALRRGWAYDPFTALLDTRAGQVCWEIEDFLVRERVCRRDAAQIRRELTARLRDRIRTLGGVWARIAPFPHPYRSAFNLRIDLDETNAEDYFRFARARAPLADCTSHFVSTAAYGHVPVVLADLRAHDTHSHGHHHVVYRDSAANLANLERAHRILTDAGIHSQAFAAPEGRWNRGINSALEAIGYAFSSEFQVGYDDLPFFPWRGERFSRVLQVPIHPICEGLFLNAGASDGRAATRHLCRVVDGKIQAGEPAFVYGHPERRLGRHPEVISELAGLLRAKSLVWRTTLLEFARWWLWRGERTWSLRRHQDQLEIQCENWNSRYPIAIEIDRGTHVASVALGGPRTSIADRGLVFERAHRRFDSAHGKPAPLAPRYLLRAVLHRLLDWETITPIGELPEHNAPARWKKRLRIWRSRAGRFHDGSMK